MHAIHSVIRSKQLIMPKSEKGLRHPRQKDEPETPQSIWQLHSFVYIISYSFFNRFFKNH